MMPKSGRELYGVRGFDPVSGYAPIHFASLFLLVMPLCNRTGASYFEHIFSIICWGSFNLSLRFIGTGWLLQGSFWMERISCRLGLLPVASLWTCNPGLWVTTVKNQRRSLPFFLPLLLACKAHFSLPVFLFVFSQWQGKKRGSGIRQ